MYVPGWRVHGAQFRARRFLNDLAILLAVGGGPLTGQRAAWPHGKLTQGVRMNVRTVTALLLVAVGCKAPSQSQGAATAEPAAVPTPPPPPKEPTVVERLAKQEDLAGALALIQPMFKDAFNEPDPAGMVFAGWAAHHLTWADIQGVTQTKRSLVMKDPDAERGKRLCPAGSVIQIQVDRSAGKPVAHGLLLTDSMDIYKFSAVGSSGELVEKSVARLCGIVIGKYDYSNSAGGTGHAVALVGMFDLPENKPAK